MKEIYRWVDKENKVHEYRFMDGVCEGFFTDGVESALEQNYKGKPITDTWLSVLPIAGFNKITD